MSTVIEVDERRRISLGKIGHHSRYVVHEESDGTIVMEPAVVLTQAEAKLMAMPELLARIESGDEHPEQYRPRISRAERAKRATEEAQQA